MLHVAPAVVYVACVFVVGSLPQGPETQPPFPYFDKVGHLLAFGVMQWVVLRPVRFLWYERPLAWQLTWTFAVVCLVGALLELWQGLLPTRSMEFLDWVADTTGALLAALVLRRTAHLPETR